MIDRLLVERRATVPLREHQGDGVVEGRDIATVVFPESLLKVYLTASPMVRAQRRVAQIGGGGDTIAREIASRDEGDSTRADSPLHAASDSVVVDTSHRSIDDVRREEMSRVPLGKMSTPAEVAALVQFLVSGNQVSITGQVLDINGGAVMA